MLAIMGFFVLIFSTASWIECGRCSSAILWFRCVATGDNLFVARFDIQRFRKTTEQCENWPNDRKMPTRQDLCMSGVWCEKWKSSTIANMHDSQSTWHISRWTLTVHLEDAQETEQSNKKRLSSVEKLFTSIIYIRMIYGKKFFLWDNQINSLCRHFRFAWIFLTAECLRHFDLTTQQHHTHDITKHTYTAHRICSAIIK